MTHPILHVIDELNRLTLEKHAWLFRASDQLKESTREPGVPKKQPGSNQ